MFNVPQFFKPIDVAWEEQKIAGLPASAVAW
jgi:hypothetical protein